MEKKIKLVLGITVLFVIVLLALNYGPSFGLKLPFAFSGTNTLSLSQAQLQSSNYYLSGKVWLLTFASGGLGQHYTGTFYPSDVQSATPDSSTTTKPFTLNVDYSDQTCNYAIVQTSYNTPIRDIIYKTWTYIPIVDPCSVDEAKSRGISSVLYVAKPTLSVTCYAWGYNTQSPVGNLQNPNLQSQFTITINADGKTATKIIDTLSGSTQGAVGDYAYASWLGNLVSGQSCPSQSPYIPIYVNGQWKTGSKSAYDSYISLLNSPIPSTSASLNDYLIKLQQSSANAKLSTSFGSINSATSLTNAVVKITLQNQIQFPVTTLYIKASTIGIYTPTPNFVIVSSDSNCFKTGEQGGIVVTLRNDGESGAGNVYAQCSSPFQTTGSVQVSLNNGESKTIVLPLSGTASSKTTGSCTVYIESPGGTKSKSVDTCVDPQITCQANSRFCAVSGTSEVVKQCSSDGATSSIIQVCSVGETCEVDKCVVGNGGDRESIWDKIKGFFSDLFSGIGSFFSIIKLIISIIAGLISLVFSLDLFGRSNTLRKYAWLIWIFSLIVGGLIFWLIFTVFYVGLIVFVIYLIIKIIIGGHLLAFKTAAKRLKG